LQALLAGIALGMSKLPEVFPLILTVFTVMGAWRISRANVLTRRASAIEALGEATVLCTDKTGTLTENQMAIAELSGHHVWRFENEAELTVAAKGAPEAIAALCLLTSEERDRLTQAAEEMGRKGLRVLAVAKASVKIKRVYLMREAS
jgi:Ca2+-transporting ATPase